MPRVPAEAIDPEENTETEDTDGISKNSLEEKTDNSKDQLNN